LQQMRSIELVLLYLLGSALIALIFRQFRNFSIFFSILTLSGTLAHELSHWICGWFSNAKPSSLSIIPKRVGNTFQLGAVKFENMTWYNGWIGLSPLLLLPAAYYLSAWRAPYLSSPEWSEVGWVYLNATLLVACLPSVQDIRMVLKHSWRIILLIVLAGIWLIFDEKNTLAFF
jgi:hypothetical protein